MNSYVNAVMLKDGRLARDIDIKCGILSENDGGNFVSTSVDQVLSPNCDGIGVQRLLKQVFLLMFIYAV